jgi:BMFP domain-containing protein YqiC
MTQSSNRIFDELARFATDAAGAAQGVRKEVESVVRSQFERLIKDMDVATREETERLEARVKDLEAKLASTAGVNPATP